MNEPVKKNVYADEILSGLVFVLCGIMFGVTSVKYDPLWRWADYFKTYNLVGVVGMIVAVIWFVLAILRNRTKFFDVTQKISPDEFSVTIGIIAIVTVIALFTTFSKLPTFVTPQVAPDDPGRPTLVKYDKNLKILVTVAILLSAAAVGSAPLRRFFKR